jgi:hypothetical protein
MNQGLEIVEMVAGYHDMAVYCPCVAQSSGASYQSIGFRWYPSAEANKCSVAFVQFRIRHPTRSKQLASYQTCFGSIVGASR